MSTSSPPPIVLYDGHCALCNRWVRFLLWADVGGILRFAALTSETAHHLLATHPALADVDSLILLRGGHAYVRSAAVLHTLESLGGRWLWLSQGFAFMPTWLGDRLYEFVARWRYRAFGHYAACPLPSPDVRDRFMP